MVVGVLKEFRRVLVLFNDPVVVECSRVELLQVFFGCDIFCLFVSEEDILLIKLVHVQVIAFLFLDLLIQLFLRFLLAGAVIFHFLHLLIFFL